MGIFDFATNTVSGNNKVKDECIIAFKVYDACRQQDCLDPSVLGAARAAVNTTYCGISVDAGEVITPPSNAAAVSVSNVAVERVVIVSKTQSPFRVGYWDIDLKYVFAYTLTFRDINGGALCSVPAQSVYNKTITLFGSVTTESSISTDLLTSTGNTIDVNADPFVYVESKAVALKAELNYGCCCGNNDTADSVGVTIGLFTIIKLFRLVNLLVESKGFCIPEECTNTGGLSVCDDFDSLDFPMDVFAPPQKREFLAGISSNIPNDNTNTGNDSNCGCNCGNNGCGCTCR